MSDVLDYSLEGAVAVLTIDDGKANVVSPSLLTDLHQALDRAESEARAVALIGRPGKFSAGFDLSVMTSSTENMRALVTDGCRFLMRLFTFPLPVVAGCTGHALAAGALILLSSDVRIGGDAPAKIGLNEVAIGMPLPSFAVELARYRMPPSRFDSAVLGQVFGPADAVRAGYLDRVVPADEVVAAAKEEAAKLSALQTGAVLGTKQRARGALAERALAEIEADMAGITGPSA